jgi:MFS family permease
MGKTARATAGENQSDRVPRQQPRHARQVGGVALSHVIVKLAAVAHHQLRHGQRDQPDVVPRRPGLPGFGNCVADADGRQSVINQIGAGETVGEMALVSGDARSATASSVMCGLASSLSMLVFLRVLQGAGGGGLGPSEQGILADTFVPAKRGMAFAIYGMAVILAPAIGPALGGWITDHYSWRWLFFINIPAGLLSLTLTYRMIRDPPYLIKERRKHRRNGLRIDFLGLLLVATFLGPLQVMLDRGEEDNWFGSHLITALAVVAAVSLVLLIWRELVARRPVVDIRLFRNRTFALAILLMFIMGYVMYGNLVLMPQYVQVMLGWSAERAGMVLSPGGLTLLLLMPVVGFLVGKVDARVLIASGFALAMLALYHMTGLDAQIDYRNAVMMRIDVHGGARHEHCECRPAPYRGRVGRHPALAAEHCREPCADRKHDSVGYQIRRQHPRAFASRGCADALANA